MGIELWDDEKKRVFKSIRRGLLRLLTSNIGRLGNRRLHIWIDRLHHNCTLNNQKEFRALKEHLLKLETIDNHTEFLIFRSDAVYYLEQYIDATKGHVIW